MADRRVQLETVIQTAIDSALKEVHTCLPAVVTKVNMAEQLIDAQISIKRKLGGELVLLPILVNVPIRYWRSKTFSITFPIEIGDHVRIIFSERSIDTWLTYGGIQDPFDFRKFSLSDAFAEPAMYPQTDLIPDFNPTNLEIKTNSGSTKIVVKASEDVEVTTTGEVKVNCSTLIATASTSANITTPVMTVEGNLIVTGQITSPTIIAGTSLTVADKEMNNHTHPQGSDSSGDNQQNTGAPI